MNFYLNVFEEIENILEKCNHDTYLKICNAIEYIKKNYKGEIDELAIPNKKFSKKKKNNNANDINNLNSKVNNITIENANHNKTKRGRKGAKIECVNSIRNYFKVVKPEQNDLNGTDTNTNTVIGDNNNKTVSPINIFFLYGNFNIIIIIYYILYKLNLFNDNLFINDNNKTSYASNSNNSINIINNSNSPDFSIFNNKNISHIICLQLKDNFLDNINDVLKDMLTIPKSNSFKIFIFEAFHFLPVQFRKIFINKAMKSKNLIFIHSNSYLSDSFISNCLYIRIPKPNQDLFNNHILSVMQKKYKVDFYKNETKNNNIQNENIQDLKQYTENAINSCNYDLPLILVIIYLIQLNNFPDINKIIKLIINSNIKKLINTIHKCIMSTHSFISIRNILYSILLTYNFDIHNFLNIFCNQLISFHKYDDNYKKELYSLFSEYSYYCAIHDNHICTLENLVLKIITIEKKYVDTTHNHCIAMTDETEAINTSRNSGTI
ncbi:conserved Plasmodium protein, unknown function [Plasmodium vinckei]|uniref:Uncharacterized protein n=1 Tax=Plasmodium vinckei TaxID=5860 RepID=A0A6V7SDG1_PLAVN|nr:conserved Plasmodium protein, unknown function [Plasmodium vinckei]